MGHGLIEVPSRALMTQVVDCVCMLCSDQG